MDYQLLIGDCLETLKTLPEQSVHTCVTSPPYFGLRSYMPEAMRIRDNLTSDEREYVERELDRLGVRPTPEVV